MANVNAPNGFEPVGLLKGAPTLGRFIRKIAQANTTPIFFGEALPAEER